MLSVTPLIQSGEFGILAVFSSDEQLSNIRHILENYVSLPFSTETIPGAIMEAVLAYVRDGQVLKTYDFVDVIQTDLKIGWQVKSTKAATPVTWKRAKIANALELIDASNKSASGLQSLGDSIINFCNTHAHESMELYGLDKIGYSRLILNKNLTVTYIERVLCSKDAPNIFDPANYVWKWSLPKKTIAKEQLPALHGINIQTKKKDWAWHGLGENQLHFSGENQWWPPAEGTQAVSFKFPEPDKRMSLEDLLEMLSSYKS
ncbi:hypothetical protein [Parasphingorhabdus sp.]|uniref:hypothetical protein n=1 Tax=Parasphingorhabdus sp. TaxID=2709688 RepID=UPI0032EBA105